MSQAPITTCLYPHLVSGWPREECRFCGHKYFFMRVDQIEQHELKCGEFHSATLD